MERPRILPLPGNSSREGSFYEEQSVASGLEWPGNSSIGIDQGAKPEPTGPDPMPFKIIDTNGGR